MSPCCCRSDAEFFKSVHLTGDGVVAEIKAAKKREEEEWAAKVVVDNVKFRPTYGVKRVTQVWPRVPLRCGSWQAC